MKPSKVLFIVITHFSHTDKQRLLVFFKRNFFYILLKKLDKASGVMTGPWDRIRVSAGEAV